MHAHSHILTAKNLLHTYKGDIPFAAWLKNFFKANKKFGSRDRKQITSLCYAFFRMGTALSDASVEEKMLAGLFLTEQEPNQILQQLKPEWNNVMSLPLEEKMQLLNIPASAPIFPFIDKLSPEIDPQLFNRSFLIQPDLYLRVRPGKKENVLDKLKEANMAYVFLDDDCIELSNTSGVDKVINLDEEAVVQDWSSQKVLDPLKERIEAGNKLKVLDCCAASGGKSILVKDRFPHAQLTVSDIRESILINLRNRFRRAGIIQYRSFVANVAAVNFNYPEKFDLVLCDAPCSGSGTWSRTPEQLHVFKKERIGYYSGLQKNIAANACKNVNRGGYFLYVTCSVFKEENEEVVIFIQSNTNLKLLGQYYFKGYDLKADTLFAALFVL